MIQHLLAATALALGMAVAQAAPVVHDIGGTLQRVSTSGVDVEAYIAAIGFDGGAFRSLLTLDSATPDSDAAANRGAYLGAVTASTVRVQSTEMGETGYCNTSLLDCSVEVVNDRPLGGGLLMDSLFLAAQVFAPAGPGLLPAGMVSFLTLNLFLADVGAAPDLLDDDGLLTDLPALLAGVPAGVDAFTLALRGFDSSSGAEFSVVWRIDTAATAVPEPGTLALVLLVLPALVGLGRAGRRSVAALAVAALCGPAMAGPGETFTVTLTNAGDGNSGSGLSLTDNIGNSGQSLPSLLGRGIVASHAVRFAAAGYSNDRFLLDPVEAGELARLNFVFTENNQLALGSGRGPKAEVENFVNVAVGATAFNLYHRLRIGSQSDETITGAIPASATLAVRGGDFVTLNVAGQTYAYDGDFPDFWSPGARGGAPRDAGSSSAISDLKFDYELTLFEDRRHWALEAAGALAEGASWVEQAAPDALSWAVFNRTSPRALAFTLAANQRWRGLIVDGESLTLNLGGRTVETTTGGASQKNYGVLVGEGRGAPSTLSLRNGRLDVASHIVVGADAGPATLTLGAGADVDSAGALLLATRAGATADVRIEDAGSLRARGLEIAQPLGSRGTLRVDGIGSTLTVDAASAGIGRGGSGELLVQGGGLVQWQATIVDIGGTSRHAAALRIVGAGSRSLDGSFNIGNGAVLEVRDGAALRSTAGGVQVTAGGSFFASAATVELDRLDVTGTGAGALLDHGTQAGAREVTVRSGSLRLTGAGTRLGVENLLVHSGHLEIGDGAVLAGDAAYIGEDARLSGDGGTLQFDRRLLADGTVAPGHSPGRLTIAGDFELGASGVLELEIAGLGAAEHDLLVVGGDALLGGRVALLFLDGFAPKAGDRLALLDVGGSFASTAGVSVSGLADGWLYTLDFAAGGLTLTSLNDAVAAVPEPPAALLLLAGLLLVAALRRRIQAVGAATR